MYFSFCGCLLLLVLFGANSIVQSGDVLKVYPDAQNNCNNPVLTNNNIQTLNDLLLSNEINDDTIVTLQEPGCYWLNSSYLIHNIVNITLTSTGPANEYIIKCSHTESSSGLSFVSITDLRLTNITIDSCHISGKHVNETVTLFNDNIDVFYRIPDKIQYGLIIADCNNLNMNQVTISNTQGLGLLAINIMGGSSMEYVQFINNRAPYCTFESLSNGTSDYTIGGGMFLSYHNYHTQVPLPLSPVQLSMKYVLFRENSYCSAYTAISSLYGQSATANNIGYVVGSAAGIGITLAQLHYSVNINIDSSNITNNTGLIGAGVHVGIFQDVSNSSVTFNDCRFTSNGYSNTLSFNRHSQSAGLFIYNDLQFPTNTSFQSNCTNSNSLYDSTSVSVNVVNSQFNDNQAHTCASYQVSSLQSMHITESNQNIFQVINTTFTGNQGSTGPVACAVSSEASGRQLSFQLIFTNVTIIDNSVRSTNNEGVVNHLIESSGHILLVSVHLELKGNTSFINNSGVAIVVINSLISFHGNIQFNGNKGVFGGAIRIHTQSYLIIHDNANVSFIGNQATVEGGAIYYSVSSVADSNPLDEGDCFLYFQYVDRLCNYSSCPDIRSMNFHLTFIDNTAQQGGTIYGSTLNSCPWFDYFSNTLTNTTALQFLSTTFRDKFHFIPPLVNASVISTNSAYLKLNDNYTNSTNPGGRISLQVLAFDSFNFRTSTALVSASENSSLISTRLGNSVYYFISSSDSEGTTVPLDVTGLQYSSVNVELFSVDSGIQSIMTISTTDCGPGFIYNSTSLACECIKELTDKGVVCEVRNQTLIIPDNYWFGLLIKDNRSIPVYSSCFYDYCRPSETIVSVLDLDYQCNVDYNRGGLSCGECMNNTSAVFGTSRCHHCTNFGLLWILGLAIAGIIVIFGISILGITITEGYLNGFIFYCNSLNYFFVYLSPKLPLDPIFSPVAWVNLGLGIESCFYNGMSTLDRIGLRLVFPLYLFILMIIIILLAQKIKKFSSLRFSASKTFATLILLSYFSILGTCIEVMAFTRYTGVYNNVSYTRWNLDPSQSYGNGLHGLLISFAVLLLVIYIIPFPLLFLFPNLLYSLPFTNKFKPIYDAFWNPFKPRLRFWLSFRAMLRLIPFALALFGSYPTNVLGMVLFIPLVWFMHERLTPFNGYWQNSFDSFFLLNLMFLFIGNIYYERYRDEYYHYPVGYSVMVYILLSAAYVAFLIILIIHVFIRFPNLKTKLSSFWKKKGSIVPRKLLYSKVSKSSIFLSQASINTQEDDLLEKDEMPRVVGYSELREPLLDEYGTVALNTRIVSI